MHQKITSVIFMIFSHCTLIFCSIQVCDGNLHVWWCIVKDVAVLIPSIYHHNKVVICLTLGVIRVFPFVVVIRFQIHSPGAHDTLKTCYENPAWAIKFDILGIFPKISISLWYAVLTSELVKIPITEFPVSSRTETSFCIRYIITDPAITSFLSSSSPCP